MLCDVPAHSTDAASAAERVDRPVVDGAYLRRYGTRNRVRGPCAAQLTSEEMPDRRQEQT